MSNHSTNESARPTPRRKRAHARAEQILGVALELFARQGFAATSTRQIAKEVGIAEGLIFHYFPTKVDLLKAVATQRHTLAGEMNAIFEEAAGTTARELVQRIAEGWLQLMRQEAQLVSMLLSESQTNPELQRAFSHIVEKQIEMLSAFLQKRVEAGELRQDLPVHASAMMLISPLVMFFITHRHLSDEAWETQAHPYIEGALDHWLQGAVREHT